MLNAEKKPRTVRTLYELWEQGLNGFMGNEGLADAFHFRKEEKTLQNAICKKAQQEETVFKNVRQEEELVLKSARHKKAQQEKAPHNVLTPVKVAEFEKNLQSQNAMSNRLLALKRTAETS